MSDFTKFKIGVALALLGVLFTLQPLVKQAESVAFPLVGFQVKLIWFFYATSALLGLSVYTYALAAVRQEPPRWVETVGNVAYACALAVPPLYVLLWISSLLAGVAGPILKEPWLQFAVSSLLGAAATIASGKLSRVVATVLGRRDKTARVDKLQTAEVFHLDRAKHLLESGLYDLSVLESFRAVEAALGAALEASDIRPRRAVQLFDTAVSAEVISKGLAGAYHELRALRNSAVHKHAPIGKAQADAAIEMAKTILEGIRRQWIGTSEEAV